MQQSSSGGKQQHGIPRQQGNAKLGNHSCWEKKKDETAKQQALVSGDVVLVVEFALICSQEQLLAAKCLPCCTWQQQGGLEFNLHMQPAGAVIHERSVLGLL